MPSRWIHATITAAHLVCLYALKIGLNGPTRGGFSRKASTQFPEVIDMNLKSFAPLLLLLAFSSPVLADTTTASDPAAEDCPMTGALSRMTEECQVFRLAFRAEISACMAERLLAARSSRGATMNAQSTRARFLICDAEVRAKLQLPLN